MSASLSTYVSETLRQRGIDVGHNLSPAAHPELSFEPPTLVTKEIRLEFPSRFGAFTKIHGPGHVTWVEIGRYGSFAPFVTLGANEHDMRRLSTSSSFENPGLYGWDVLTSGAASQDFHPFEKSVAPVRIGNDVWIGQGAFVASGVTIGNGAVVGALSCVTRDVPPYAIVAGNPARLIRYRFDHETIIRLERLAWWRFALVDLARFPVTALPECLDALERAVEAGSLEPYDPSPVTLGSLA
ncbi:CatB-related O-acetyltransferase [Xanthobacter sp. KR7-65]|uniref:CatB-related O-acetyltransferase n=1 Tax=Xanthobacter sp. KR7-65 TaxID=3156612 RepID=UPI0032B3A0D3